MLGYSEFTNGRRPIQFRGYGVDLKKWVYGSLLIDDDPTHIDSYPRIVSHKGTVRVVPESVGQFTGFYDKDGTPVFEDDIFDEGPAAVCPVFWIDAKGGFNVDRQYCAESKLIGNRFDNFMNLNKDKWWGDL